MSELFTFSSATNRKFRSKKEIDSFLADSGKPYTSDSFDFGLHRKRSKEIGWDTTPIKKKKISHPNSSNNSNADGKILNNKCLTPKAEVNMSQEECKTPVMQPNEPLEDGFGKWILFKFSMISEKSFFVKLFKLIQIH